ncbi:MAG: RNA pseudouridine synthase [Lewinellaceae bacterium]|nr:RNA pseudouridine synthase [Phaeodactylibacter sp.]MCB9037491.1 RNA pseudouridine synthase [Lewinellaceae bacterium]
MNITIIKETPGWLAVNKPAGIQVERNPFGPSVESLAYAHLAKKRGNPYVGIIHRLDRVTTGVVLVAKKKGALKELNEQFRLRKVRKTYLAMVDKAPPQAEATLTHWLEKDQQEKRAQVVDTASGQGSECTLSYRQLWVDDNGRALLEVSPITGKYHQIRAQLAAIGCPIVGDLHYGAAEAYQPNQIMLHAWKLAFFDPAKKRQVEVEAAAPEWAPKV